jgi:MoaA/NifB/PqqE/SkfB family radical SAM enzyme
MRARTLLEQPVRIFHLIRERGIREAVNYAKFRATYAVHSWPVAWAINRLNPYPYLIEVEPTTHCNLRCTMCENTYWKEERQHMRFADFLYILNQFPRLAWIGFTGIGESLTNPDYLQMCKLVKDRGIYLEMFDNFTLWTSDISRQMVDMGVNHVLPSIDGATKATYESIRVGAKWETVVTNLSNLFKIKAEKGKHFPEVTIHYIVQKANVHECAKILTLARDCAQDDSVAVYFTQMFDPFAETKELAATIPESMMQDIKRNASTQYVRTYFNRNTWGSKTPYRQCTLWVEPFVFVDGTVVPCCGGNEHNNRANQRLLSMGNIFDSPFKEIWNGLLYYWLRKRLVNNECPKQCTNCPQFGK